MLFLTAWPFICAFLISALSIPVIIKVADLKHLMDEPDQWRKFHATKTPTLGGVAIFAGASISYSFFNDLLSAGDIRFMNSAMTLLFLAGIKDDILVLSASKKLAIQCFCALLVTVFGKLYITNLWGMFGIGEISPIWGMALTFLVIISLVNAFNLIDGINGLAGGLGLIACLFYGTWFALTGFDSLSCLAFALAGALLGFLFYNFGKAKIFMGDTGSMLIGFIVAILGIKFIENNRLPGFELSPYYIKVAPAVAVAVVFIPLMDMTRVFILRLLNGKSPFAADRNHIHHILIDSNFSHTMAASLLLMSAMVIIGFALVFQGHRSLDLVIILAAIGTIACGSLHFLKKKSKGILGSEVKLSESNF